jgi:drug/metabolite transporter (DMT)-like permease
VSTGVSLLTTSGGDPNLGDAVCVLSAVLFGVHKWRSETITSRVKDTAALVALQLAVLGGSSILLAVPEAADAITAAPSLSALVHSTSALTWLEIVFMGVGTTALTLWIEMDSLKEVSAPLAALIYSAEPLWGAAFAWVLLDERWGAQGWVGAVLIVSASLASQLGGDPAEHAKKEV